MTSEARHVTDLNGVRVYLLHRKGRGGGHFAAISDKPAMSDVVALPDGAVFGSQAKLRQALSLAAREGGQIVNVPGVGAVLRYRPS
jgi:hypothetical protein